MLDLKFPYRLFMLQEHNFGPKSHRSIWLHTLLTLQVFKMDAIDQNASWLEANKRVFYFAEAVTARVEEILLTKEGNDLSNHALTYLLGCTLT